MDYATRIANAYPSSAPIAHDIVRVSEQIGAHPFDLANLIRFESGGTFSPSVKNRWSGATGLIQFYPGLSKKSLGVTTDELAQMTASEQMVYVQKYLNKARRKKRLDTPQKLYMSVFYPVAISWSSDRRFPSHVPKANPGIFTPADYTDFVDELAKLPPSTDPASAPQVDSPESPLPVASSLPGPPTSLSSSWSWPWSSAGKWTNNTDSMAYLFQGDHSYSDGVIEPGVYRVRVRIGPSWYVLASEVVVKPNTGHTLTNLNGRWQWNNLVY